MAEVNKPHATVGIICEFNPFHNGHAYLLQKAHELGDCVVCVMSGRTVQRGTVAVTDPYIRAEIALLGGADLVLELPFPWSSGSAAYFASAGVRILTALGIDCLLFGSECGSINDLQRAAQAVRSEDFVARYTALCEAGEGTAAAYRNALQEQLPDHSLGANDLLGVAYLEAIAAQKSSIIPYTVKRLGDGYHEAELHSDVYPSATALRARMGATPAPAVLENELKGSMPAPCLARLLTAMEQGDAPADQNRLLDTAHSTFRLASPETMTGIAELSGGLGDRMLQKARTATDGQAFFEALKTRLYPDARLCRGMLFGLTRTRTEDLAAAPTYTTVLAANRAGCDFLSTLRRKDTALTVVTKAAEAPEGRQKELSDRADALLSLCLPTPRHAGWLMQRSPFILKD